MEVLDMNSTKGHVTGDPAGLGALQDLARAAGLDLESAALQRLGTPQEGGVPLDPLQWIAHLSATCGLPLERLEIRGRELDHALDDDRPLLYRRPEEEAGRCPGWCVFRRAGDTAHVIERLADSRRQWSVPVTELAAALGLGPDGSGRFLATGPSAERFRSPRSAETSPLRRLGAMLRPDRRDLLAVAAFSVATGVLLLAAPVAVQALVNFVALGGAIPPLLVVSLLLFLALGLAGVLSGLQVWVVEFLQRRIFVRTVAELAARLPAAALESPRRFGPELVNRYFDLATIQKTGSFLLLDGLSVLLSVLVGLVVLAFYHPLLLAFDILLLAVIALIVLGPVRRGIRSAREESSAKYRVAASLEEIAANPTLFRSSGVIQSVFERTDALVGEWVERRSAHFRVVFGQTVAAIGLQVVASTALLGIGGLLVIRGSLTLGQLVAAELILTLVVSSVAKMGKHLEAFYDLMAATDKVGALLDVPLERGGGRTFVPRTARGVALQLTDVAWAPSEGASVLSGVDLVVEPGERVGVHGTPGSGKSTLLGLVWGTRTPTAGSILVDGQDLRELSLESLRRSVCLIDREEFFEGSVRENVRLGRSFVTDEDVHEALRRVGLLDALVGLPDGLETPLGPGGSPLSRGELALLQVARAVAGRPRLILAADSFDELGPEARGRVLDLLFDDDAPWSLLFATNSADPLDRCSRTLVLDDGKLTEDVADLVAR